jgi:hypothetical protein
VKVLLRAGIVVAAAAGFCLAFSAMAAADVVDPQSPYQPASTQLMLGKATPKGADGREALAQSNPLEQTFGESGRSDEVVATPAPEQIVSKAPVHVERRAYPRDSDQGSVLDRAASRVEEGFQEVVAFLGQVTSAGQGSAPHETGGPVLVLAVLGLVSALARRRVFAARWVTDDEMPELLYASEVIAPG